MTEHAKKTVVLAVQDYVEAARVQNLLTGLDVQVITASTVNLQAILGSHLGCQLVIAELGDHELDLPTRLEHDLAANECALLALVDLTRVADLRLPVQVRADFAVKGATDAELAARIKMLLWPGTETSASDVLVQGPLTINLATYQVTVYGESVDFTYLEYALLSFLVTHPGRAYQREVLLQRIWGYEYFGGTRTVDVHVRRIRAKLGTELGAKVETVRGVGYMWNM